MSRSAYEGNYQLTSDSRPRDEASRKLYRRIWWSLHVSLMSSLFVSDTDGPKNRDIFHFFVNTQNLRLLVTAPPIEPLTEEDWEIGDSDQTSDLLSPTTHQQKVSLIAHCELAQICESITIFGACEVTDKVSSR